VKTEQNFTQIYANENNGHVTQTQHTYSNDRSKISKPCTFNNRQSTWTHWAFVLHYQQV